MKVKSFNIISINKIKRILYNVAPDLNISRESINKLQLILKKIFYKILTNIMPSKRVLNVNDLTYSVKNTFGGTNNNTLFLHSNNYAIKTLSTYFSSSNDKLLTSIKGAINIKN